MPADEPTAVEESPATVEAVAPAGVSGVIESDAIVQDDVDISRVRSSTNEKPAKKAQDENTIKCEVVDPEKIGEGQRAYVVYKVVTKSKRANMDNSNVQRRYSDFEWLQKQLNIECPRYIIPRIPSKARAQSLRGVDDEFIEKRRFLLGVFLNRITEHGKMSQAICVNAFLTQSNVDFDYTKKTSENKSLIDFFSSKVDKLRLTETDDRFSMARIKMTDLIRELNAYERNCASQRKNTIEVATDLNESGQIFGAIGDIEPHFKKAMTEMDKAYTSLVQELVDKTGNESCSVIERIHELSTYAEACVSLLGRRDLIEFKSLNASQDLEKKEADLAQNQAYPPEKFKSFFGKSDPAEMKRRKIVELKADVEKAKIVNEEAQSDLKLWNKVVMEQLETFDQTRKRDLRYIFQRQVNINVRHHARSKVALEKILPTMQAL